jgi:hypothetical protein
MSLSAKLRRAPMRAVTGAFILNSGVSKFSADDETAKLHHEVASGTYGFVGKVDPKVFTKGLGAAEIAVGGLVLAPVVSPVVAGLGLIAFSGAVLNMYWNTPGMHADGNPRPTPQGSGVAKDVWMLGIGVGLVADGLLEPAHDKKVEIGAAVQQKRVEKGRRARKAAKKAQLSNRDALRQAREAARDAQLEATKRAQKAATKAQKRALKASDQAAKRLAEVRAEYGPVVVEKAKAAREAARDLADEYGPVVAEKAMAARDAARAAADEYAPVVAEKAKAARDAARAAADEYAPVVAEKAKAARDSARDLADEYRPVVAEKAKAARESARHAAARAQHAVS